MGDPAWLSVVKLIGIGIAGLMAGIAAWRSKAAAIYKQEMEARDVEIAGLEKRVATLEAQIGELRAENAGLREKTDMSPILRHLDKQTDLLAKLCAQHDDHGKTLERIATETTGLAVAFGETLAPKIRQSIEKDSQ